MDILKTLIINNDLTFFILLYFDIAYSNTIISITIYTIR